MASRAISGTIFRSPGNIAWSGARITFRLLTTISTTSTTTYPLATTEVLTASDGTFSIALATPESGDGAWLYEMELPDNQTCEFSLEEGPDLTLAEVVSLCNSATSVAPSNFDNTIIYEALITQALTGTPTIIESRNTTGATATPARLVAGDYTLTFSSAVLTAGKVHVRIGTPTLLTTSIAALRQSDAVISIITGDPGTGIGADSILTNTSLLVKIYP